MTLSFSDLLKSAVLDPGTISQAYSQFHNYSMGNMLLALVQCVQRGITPGPIATFLGWKDKGRYVRKGEKAITLCMPVTIKRKGSDEPVGSKDPQPEIITRFMYRPHWFVLSQTEGAPLEAVTVPSWDRAQAIATLGVSEVPFDALNGNVMGYARQRSIAISPLNPLPLKTTFHELAHVLLGHTSEGDQADGEITPRSLRECEAEAVALLCCAALELPGVTEARGYIQGWWGAGNPIPERSAQHVMKVADQILKAGRTETSSTETA